MDVIDDVKQKVSSIQDTIACISQVQQHLKNNCIEAKSDIHSSISRQLETLRSREVWLLNQVDVIRHIKEERLQGQLACLLHELGGLQHLIQIAQSCGENCADLKQELVETLNRLKDLDDVPVEKADIQFNADMMQLRRAVCNFGSVESQGHAMEDYPMTEACNSLSELNLMNQARTRTRFPPFDCATRLADWLAENETDDFVMLENDYHKLKMPSFDEYSDEVKSSEEYFHDITLSPLAEWLLDCGRFQADFAVDRSYPFVMKYFREISNDVKDWLLDYEKSQEEDMEEDSQGKECKDLCHCTGPPEGFVMQAIEIENLADMLTCIQDPVTNHQKKTQPSKWLHTADNTSMKTDMAPFVLPSVKSACKANETCQDFTECVCDTNCAAEAIALENPSLERDQVLSYFQRVSKNSSDWLLPKCFENPSENSQEIPQESNWLIGDQNLQEEYVCSFPQFNSSANSSEWLRENSEATHSSKVHSSLLENRHEPTTDWLVKEVGLKLNISDESSEPTPFDAYFKTCPVQTSGWLIKDSSGIENKHTCTAVVDNNSNQDLEKSEHWLQHTHSSESQSIDENCWEVVKKYHAQMVRSDWLKSQVQPQTKSEWLFAESMSNNHSPVAEDEAFKMFLFQDISSDENLWLKE